MTSGIQFPIIVPFSAAFSPPADCFTSLTFPYYIASENGPGTTYIYNMFYNETESRTCWPPWSWTDHDLNKRLAYSPATCPTGFTTATVFTTTGAYGSHTEVDTAAWCCPDGYSYFDWYECGKVFTKFVSATAWDNFTDKSVTLVGPCTAWTQKLLVLWKEAELSAFTTTTTANERATSTKPGAAAKTTATPSATNTSNSSTSGSSGLTKDQQIQLGTGIGVGIPGHRILTAP